MQLPRSVEVIEVGLCDGLQKEAIYSPNRGKTCATPGIYTSNT